MNKFFGGKIIIFLAVLTLVFGGSLVFDPPKKANAIPVVCANCSQLWSDAVEWGVEAARWVKDELLKSIRDAVVKRLIDYMTDQTIAWINGGGQPQFITDWQGFLRSAANTAVGDVVSQTNAAFLCAPFKARVAIALLPVPKYTQNISCTFDKIVGNLDAFYQDFRNGSWLGYTTAWQPENNYYGTLLRVHDEMLTRTAEAVTSAQNQGVADKGFLAVKKCTQYDYSGSAEVCDTAYTSCIEGGQSADECEQISIQCFDQNKTCSKKETTTPGDTVGEAVRTAIGSDAQWVANVQSAVSAIVNALINKLVTKGLIYAVGSANQVNTSSGADYTAQFRGALNSANSLNKRTMIDEMKKAIAEWQYLLTDKNSSLLSATSTLDILNKIKSGEIVMTTCGTNDLDGEIKTAQTNVDKLKADVYVLNGEITDVGGFISQIATADFTETNQLTDAQTIYMSFMDNYDTDNAIQSRVEGSGRQAADAEAEAMKSTLNKVSGYSTLSCLGLVYRNENI